MKSYGSKYLSCHSEYTRTDPPNYLLRQKRTRSGSIYFTAVHMPLYVLRGILGTSEGSDDMDCYLLDEGSFHNPILSSASPQGAIWMTAPSGTILHAKARAGSQGEMLSVILCQGVTERVRETHHES